MKVKNVGLSKVDIRQEGTALTIKGADPGWSREIMAVDWAKASSFAILKGHGWIEPGETVVDDRIIVVPEGESIAFHLELRVSNGKIVWNGTGLAEIKEADAKDKESADRGSPLHERPERGGRDLKLFTGAIATMLLLSSIRSRRHSRLGQSNSTQRDFEIP